MTRINLQMMPSRTTTLASELLRKYLLCIIIRVSRHNIYNIYYSVITHDSEILRLTAQFGKEKLLFSIDKRLILVYTRVGGTRCLRRGKYL